MQLTYKDYILYKSHNPQKSNTKLSPKAIGIPENKTSNVKTATIMAIIKGSIN